MSLTRNVPEKLKGSYDSFVSMKMPKTISSVSRIFWWIIGGKVFRKKLAGSSCGSYGE